MNVLKYANNFNEHTNNSDVSMVSPHWPLAVEWRVVIEQIKCFSGDLQPINGKGCAVHGYIWCSNKVAV